MSQSPLSQLQNSGGDFTSVVRHDTYDFINPLQFDLKDRAVLVTGASKGIGRETALSFAKAGASYIAIAARSSLEDLETEILSAANGAGRESPKVIRLSLDVTSEQSVREVAKATSKAFGRLDVVINNAGYFEKVGLIQDIDADDWWRAWEVNIRGPFLVTKALLPLMLQSKDSLRTILNVSSIGSHFIVPGMSAYMTNKLALLRFGEFLCAENASEDLISFGIHPGGVQTDLSSGLPDSMKHTLLDTPALAADSVVWLTAERRAWLKGRYVSVQWDMEQLLEKRHNIEEGDLLKVRMDVGVA